jgi:hypothetical protein
MSNEIPLWVKQRLEKPGRPVKYPFAETPVGGSFVILKKEQTCSYESFRHLTKVKNREGFSKFHCRIRPEDGAFEVYRSE